MIILNDRKIEFQSNDQYMLFILSFRQGYLLRHWYTLSLATSVPFILLFSYYWIIPESPRWLLSKNRIDEAEVIVQHMAKVNGKTVPTNFLRKMEVTRIAPSV